LSFGENGKPTLMVYALAERKQGGAAPAPQAAAAPAPTTTAALTSPDTDRGKELFVKNCAACHGNRGEGGSGPTLKGIRNKLDTAATINWVKNPSAKMPRLYPSTLDEQAVTDIVAYVQGF
jgi:mono/diheme cytochrome c family protein